MPIENVRETEGFRPCRPGKWEYTWRRHGKRLLEVSREASLGGVDIDLLGQWYSGILLYCQLTPPTKAEAWFPNDHMITGLTDRTTITILVVVTTEVKMSWVIGIKSGDREAWF